MNRFDGKNIWIIGASSGIGKALSLELSRRGASLVLSARDESKLQAVNIAAGAAHKILPFDVTSQADMQDAAKTVLTTAPRLDSVIYLAGHYKPMDLKTIDLDEMISIINTNVIGAFYLIKALLPSLLERKSGQIVLCASVAGYRGLPHAQPYGASKAALINLCETLRAETRGTGVDVKLINPGFVRTPMTAKNNFPMPAMIEPEQAAKAIADALGQRSFEIHFPRRFTWPMKILRLLPAWLYFKIVPQ